MGSRQHMTVPFEGSYMKYQRLRIRSLQKTQGWLIAVIVLLVIGLSVSLYHSIGKDLLIKDLKCNVGSLHQMIAEKNDTIVKQEKQIKTMQDNESARIISTVKKLTGGIIDKYTAVVYLEATNQGKTGMQLVADTIYNRTNEPKFKETTISGVLKYPMQFNALTKLSTITDQTKQSQQYKQAYDIVISKLLYGTAISNDTLYFMNPSISNRGAANWMFRKQIVITYKDHVFFK